MSDSSFNSTLNKPMVNIFFGGGGDGDLNSGFGAVTLTKDAYYRNVTLIAGDSIYTAGFKVFISGNLDLSNAPANAIHCNGIAGTSAVGSTAGVGGTPAITQATTGINVVGLNGAVGQANNGAGGIAASPLSRGNTGASGNAGAGGASATKTGGGVLSGTPAPLAIPINYMTSDLVSGNVALNGGQQGPSGASGGGDGVNTSGAGGGSGSTGGVLYLAAKNIIRGASTAASAISARCGASGNGGTPAAGICGGGSGAGGGSGGFIYLIYSMLSGTPATNLIDASGAAGGAGGNGLGLGSFGGNGGNGGDGGRVNTVNATTGRWTSLLGTTGSTGGTASGLTGGTAGAAGTALVTL